MLSINKQILFSMGNGQNKKRQNKMGVIYNILHLFYTKIVLFDGKNWNFFVFIFTIQKFLPFLNWKMQGFSNKKQFNQINKNIQKLQIKHWINIDKMNQIKLFTK